MILLCCCCLPCNHCSNWTRVVEEMLAYGNGPRFTHCREFHYLKLCRPAGNYLIFTSPWPVAMGSDRVTNYVIQPTTTYFLLQNAALRTTSEVCMSVRLFQLFCHLLNKSSGNPYLLKICAHMQYFFSIAPMKNKKCKKFSVREGTALFGHEVHNNFFALIKKIFLQSLVEIIFGYLEFWDPLGTP